MANLRQGASLIVFGLVFVVFGGFVYSLCTTQAPVGNLAPNCTGPAVVLGIGIFVIVVGVILVAASGRRPRVIQQVADPSVPPPIIQPVVVQQTVEHDVVKIRCPFCGSLYDVTAKACPSCGAPVG
jgi:uncharacterized membrane protein YidH (DUF202 family)